MKFHKEGRKSIVLATLVALALVWLAFWQFDDVRSVQSILILLGVFVMVIILQFFRNPRRRFVFDESGVLAPADGKVVVIEEVEEPEYFKDKRKQVSIFMSPLNVHINWYPVSGKIIYEKYHPGKYLVAWHPKSSTENERTTVVIEHPKYGPVLVRQIAGAMARRIVCYSKEGTAVAQGEELGFIKFGSRVDIFLPLDADIHAELEQISVGGQTVIAHFNSKSE